MLGNCYYNGEGVTQDYEEAVEWFTKSAEQGLREAQHRLGNCYNKGKGVTKDYREAVKWLTKAAEQGDMTAKGELRVIKKTGSNPGGPMN